jgi:alpha-glucosidase
MTSRALAALLLVACVPVRATAGALTVEARTLRATVETDPWHLRFTDADGTPVLTEAGAPAADAPGPLAVRTAAGWVHATRVVHTRRRGRHRLSLVADTTDPDGRRLAVDVRAAGEGIVAVRVRVVGGPAGGVTAFGIGFEAAADERFFGFGERSTGVDQRGAVLEDYVADGPYRAIERDLVSLFVPPPGFRSRDDATYFPIPWLLSSRGVGVLVDDDETSYFRLGTSGATRWSVEVTGAFEDDPTSAPPPDELAFRVFAGPTPAAALARFTKAVGRQPAPAAPWVLGPWVQLTGSLENRLAQLTAMRAADAPVSVVQTYTHYLPCGDQVGREASERAQVEALHAAGVAVTTYFNPMICESYEPRFDEAVAAGALTLDPTGAPYVYPYTGSTVFRVGQFDFSARAGRRAYGRLLREAIEAGYDGWMEDFGEYTPLDARTHGGLTGSAPHNRYPRDYHCAAWDVVRRARRPIVRFQRSGWTGAARCAQVVWNGDPTTDWGFDGLTSALWGGLSMGLSGVALWGSDIGGFFALGDAELTPELLMRWVQLGAVSGVMRTESNGFAVPADKVRPQIFDPAQLANWTRWTKLRTQLLPYLAAAVATYRRTGMPLMRHMVLVAPDDPEATARSDQLLFGPDLLAAPVLGPGVREREVYLPGGDWVDLWRSGTWDSAAGAFVLGAVALHAGRAAVTVPAPLEELPLFVRAGAVVPLLSPDVDTLAGYGDDDPGLVTLGDRMDRLTLLAFPRGDETVRFFDRGERLRSHETPAGWEIRLRGRRRRTYTLEASLATLARLVEPCAVEWNGRALPADAWSWDAGTRVLRATFTARRGRLLVRGCGA